MRIKLLLSLVCLGIGSLKYLLFVQDVIFLRPFQKLLPEKIILPQNTFTDIVIGQLADGFWYTALILTVDTIPHKEILSKMLFIFALALPFILEILQYCSLQPGVFSIGDLITYTIILTTFLISKLCAKSKSQNVFGFSSLQ